jgi:hypothetical protein
MAPRWHQNRGADGRAAYRIAIDPQHVIINISLWPDEADRNAFTRESSHNATPNRVFVSQKS